MVIGNVCGASVVEASIRPSKSLPNVNVRDGKVEGSPAHIELAPNAATGVGVRWHYTPLDRLRFHES